MRRAHLIWEDGIHRDELDGLRALQGGV